MKKIILGIIIFFGIINSSFATLTGVDENYSIGDFKTILDGVGFDGEYINGMTVNVKRFSGDVRYSINGGSYIDPAGNNPSFATFGGIVYITNINNENIIIIFGDNVLEVYNLTTQTRYAGSIGSNTVGYTKGDQFVYYTTGGGNTGFELDHAWAFITGGNASTVPTGGYIFHEVSGPPEPTVLFDYTNLSCQFESKYSNFFSYVPFNYNELNEVIPAYVPEGTQIFELQDNEEIKLFSGLVGYDSFTGSFDRATIYNTGSTIDINSRVDVLKYNFLWFDWGENLNQEIGGYSDRYTHLAISTGSGTYFNYLDLEGIWIGGDQESNNFIVEYFDYNQNNIVSFATLFDFGEKIHLPSLTRRVNIYFKDGSVFDLEKIDLGQVGICTESNGVYIPFIIEELTISGAILPPDETIPNLFIDDLGLDNIDYTPVSGDYVFFPADGTQAENTVTVPGECAEIGGTWQEDYGCVTGFFMQFIVKGKLIVDNTSKLFKELLKLGSDEEKSFFSFLIPGVYASEVTTSTGYTTAFKNRMTEFSEDDDQETTKMLKFFYWGLLLVAIMVTFVVSFNKG